MSRLVPQKILVLWYETVHGACEGPFFFWGDAMSTGVDRRRDLSFRQVIDEYRKLAAEAHANAARSNNEIIRGQYLSLAQSLEALIETLQDRQSSQID